MVFGTVIYVKGIPSTSTCLSLENAALLVPGVIADMTKRQEKGIEEEENTGGGIGVGENGEGRFLKDYY